MVNLHKRLRLILLSQAYDQSTDSHDSTDNTYQLTKKEAIDKGYPWPSTSIDLVNKMKTEDTSVKPELLQKIKKIKNVNFDPLLNKQLKNEE